MMNRRHSIGEITMLILFALCSCGSTFINNGGNSDSGTSTGGPVSISTNRTTYAPTDSIEVSITNHMQMSIFAYDTRASCTILGLQVQANGVWQDTQVARCSLGRPAMRVEIAANKTYTATIKAGSQGVTQADFPAGTYRLVLTYSTSATGLSQQTNQNGTTIYSATFNVVSSS